MIYHVVLLLCIHICIIISRHCCCLGHRACFCPQHKNLGICFSLKFRVAEMQQKIIWRTYLGLKDRLLCLLFEFSGHILHFFFLRQGFQLLPPSILLKFLWMCLQNFHILNFTPCGLQNLVDTLVLILRS